MPTASRRPWTVHADGLEPRVRVTPRAGLDGVNVLADGRAVLRVKVRAVPENGAANAAVGALLHEILNARLRCPRDAITLASGATGRVKALRIAGDGDALAAALAECIPGIDAPLHQDRHRP